MKTLVMGWFSFEKADATAGDLIAKDVVCEWLDGAGCAYEVALADPFRGGVALEEIDPAAYSHVVFVCGPFFKNNLLQRFEGSRLVGVNLSMVEPVEEWNPFDLLLERDSSATSRPDITFLGRGEAGPNRKGAPRNQRAPRRGRPAVGVVLMDPLEIAHDRVAHEAANSAIDRLLEARETSVVPIDTRLDVTNRSGLRSAAEVEGLIADMDMVVTTRLHGLVLALKNRVPAVALDPIPGGDKVTRQARGIGWPLVFGPDATERDLQRAVDLCLTEEARGTAARCRDAAVEALGEVRGRFIEAMQSAEPADSWGDGRRRRIWLEAEPSQGRQAAKGEAGWARRAAGRLWAGLRRARRS